MARLNHLTLFVRGRSTASDWYVRERQFVEDAPRCVRSMAQSEGV